MATLTWTSTSSTSANTAGNYAENAAPADGDTIIIGDRTGLANWATNTTFAFDLNLVVHPNAPYIGSLTTPVSLQGGSLTCVDDVGSSRGTGIRQCVVDFNGVAATVNVAKTAQQDANSTGMPPVIILGDYVTAGSVAAIVTGQSYVGFAAYPGQYCVLSSIKTARSNSGSPQVYIGPGCQELDAMYAGGSIISRSEYAATAVVVAGADWEYRGSGGFTALTSYSGTTRHLGTGTIATLTYGVDFDLSQNGNALTITNSICRNAGARIFMPKKLSQITFTNPTQFPEGGLCEVPAGMKATLAAI